MTMVNRVLLNGHKSYWQSHLMVTMTTIKKGGLWLPLTIGIVNHGQYDCSWWYLMVDHEMRWSTIKYIQNHHDHGRPCSLNLWLVMILSSNNFWEKQEMVRATRNISLLALLVTEPKVRFEPWCIHLWLKKMRPRAYIGILKN